MGQPSQNTPTTTNRAGGLLLAHLRDPWPTTPGTTPVHLHRSHQLMAPSVPCPIAADRSTAPPLQHRQQACRWLRHRYQQTFGVGPYARLQWGAGGSSWLPIYSHRELALVLGLLQVEVSSHG